MPLGNDAQNDAPPPQVPPTDKRLIVAAGVFLAIPVVALMWVPSYAKTDPELWGFPFFFWYQFLWVFLCSAATFTAYRLTLAARRGKGGPR
ncbi:MAG: hypothetical protein JWO46_196 [Nocardioidaceae bacterium]|nr:hypothetical protein [Nocardioidaceae bacterium]